MKVNAPISTRTTNKTKISSRQMGRYIMWLLVDLKHFALIHIHVFAKSPVCYNSALVSDG